MNSEENENENRCNRKQIKKQHISDPNGLCFDDSSDGCNLCCDYDVLKESYWKFFYLLILSNVPISKEEFTFYRSSSSVIYFSLEDKKQGTY